MGNNTNNISTDERASILKEFEQRKKLWEELRINGDNSVLYNDLKANHIVGTQRGIYAPMIESLGKRVAKRLLSTGTVYKDLNKGGYMFYDFPNTTIKKYDENEIDAMINSMKYRLPLFVVFGNVNDGEKRMIMVGTVTGIDNESKTFKVRLENEFPHDIP